MTNEIEKALDRALELLERINIQCNSVGRTVGGIDEIKSILHGMAHITLEAYRDMQWNDDMSTAPRDERLLLWTGQEMYCGHWAKNPFTDHEAWVVAEWGDEGDQALVTPTHWIPKPPQEEKS